MKAFTLLLLFDLLSTSAISASDQPNVVFILADDLGWAEVGCFGQKKIPTPNIDRLASEGMKLTQHYSGAPVCAPSRCVLMTGKHLGQAEIRSNAKIEKHFPEFKEGQYPLSADAKTFPMLSRGRLCDWRDGEMGTWSSRKFGRTQSQRL
jgi:arylsulfatase A